MSEKVIDAMKNVFEGKTFFAVQTLIIINLRLSLLESIK